MRGVFNKSGESTAHVTPAETGESAGKLAEELPKAGGPPPPKYLASLFLFSF